MHALRPSIGEFLREQRGLVPRDATSLGSYRRLPARHGKAVTQEEIAEALGVSRVWYSMLERGVALNASPGLLARLADAFSLSDADRDMLFRLALPALRNAVPQRRDFGALQSVRALRSAARRVWSASSENEILATVTEAVAAVFRDADFVGTFRRVQAGRWEYPILLGGRRFASSLQDLHADLQHGLTPEQIDEVMLHGVLTQPGQVGTREDLHRTISVKDRIDDSFERAGFGSANFIDAFVRSDDGFEATIFANYIVRPVDISELERSVMGTLADLASLALSRERLAATTGR